MRPAERPSAAPLADAFWAIALVLTCRTRYLSKELRVTTHPSCSKNDAEAGSSDELDGLPSLAPDLASDSSGCSRAAGVTDVAIARSSVVASPATEGYG